MRSAPGRPRPDGLGHLGVPPIRSAGVAGVFELVTRSSPATASLAAAVAPLVEPGDVLVLDGDLGAGKTVFTQGLGAALGVTDRILSPTFTIERIHRGRVRLHHLDVYRLGTIHELLDLGLDEALDDGGVAVIEWGASIADTLGRDHLLVTLRRGDGDDDRVVTFETVGPGWARRADALAAAVDAWRSGEAS